MPANQLLAYLASLTDLRLYQNQLSGEIPPELGNLASLRWLWLGGNELSGEIPPELGNLFNLISLHLDGNELSGCVPTSRLRRLSPSRLGGLPPC